MKSNPIRGAFCALVLMGSALFGAQSSGAQTVRDVRIDLHPVKYQVGIVTKVAANTAWVKLPQRVVEGGKIEFMPFSDGSDVLATGVVKWVTPLAPYEAYITDVKAVSTAHRLGDLEDRFSIAVLGNVKREYGPRPDSDGFGSYLAAGFYARALPEPPRETVEAVEPVRAHIAALRSRGTATAAAIATAAERALVKDPLFSKEDTELPVNFSILSDNLRRFKLLRIEDPITDRLLQRLLRLVHEVGVLSEAVPTDFLRPAGAVDTTMGGLPGGTIRR